MKNKFPRLKNLSDKKYYLSSSVSAKHEREDLGMIFWQILTLPSVAENDNFLIVG